MKFVVLLGVLLVVYLLWRARSRSDVASPPQQPKPPPALTQEDMVRCQVCAVHFPRSDAVTDPQGRLFCCPQHRDSGSS